MRRLLFLLFGAFLFAGGAWAQLSAPVLYPASGSSCVNFCEISFHETNTGPSTCYTFTTNGTTPATPTATVAGTCDAGIYSTLSTNAQWAPINCTSGNMQIKAIFTQAGQTNSSVTSGTYPCSFQPATNPVSIPAATNITNATAGNSNTEPIAMRDARGRVFVFYNSCACTVGTDSTGTSWTAWRVLTSGTWSTPANKACPGGSDPATGCFYDVAAMNMANNPVGGGLDYNNNLILFISQWQQPGIVNQGVLFSVCANSLANDCTLPANWTTPAFFTTPSHLTANSFDNPTANLVTIPPQSPGVTGSCANGCSFIAILGINTCVNACTGLTFNYDGTLTTWSDPLVFTTGLIYPYVDEEKALFWVPGTMDIGMFSRPGTTTAGSGGPTSPAFQYSTNMGQSWNTYQVVSTTYTGGGSNIPTFPCGVAPQTDWGYSSVRLSIAIDPNNSNLATLSWGVRLSCAVSNQTSVYWQMVTFNLASVFSGAGLNLPMPQILNLSPNLLSPTHTAYSCLAPLNSTQVMFVWEQTNLANSEDIMAATVSYPAGMQINSNIKYRSPSITFR